MDSKTGHLLATFFEILRIVRADRLIALLLLLQTRPKLTAAEVAVELEISERTARRDLEALAMSGVPIYSTPGRGGGWQLLGGAKTDLSGLSADEARALFLAVGPGLDRAPELKSALRKLSGALPETFRAEAEAAATAIKVDPSGWGRVGGASFTPAYLDTLTEAVISGHQVELDYESPRTGTSTRTVSPLGLVTKRNVWYLVAGTEMGLRTFRVSRVKNARALDSPAVRPDDFDLEAEWARITTEVASMNSGVSVEIIAESHIIKALRYQFGNRLSLGDSLPDGRTRAVISDHSARPLAAQLSCHGKALEVIDPSAELEAEFVRIAGELAETWLSINASNA